MSEQKKFYHVGHFGNYKHKITKRSCKKPIIILFLLLAFQFTSIDAKSLPTAIAKTKQLSIDSINSPSDSTAAINNAVTSNSTDIASATTAKSATTTTSSSTTWNNSSWHYRKLITIKGSSSGAQTDYQVQITVTYSSRMKSDFTDIRFTDSSGTKLLSSWLESYTSKKTATFYVKIPSIPISPSTAKIYMYYGNSSATDASDGANTFNFYEGFTTPFGSSAMNNAANYQTTPTYDGSGQAVHPDVVYFSNGWNGYKYWMAITPFPGADASYENPSIIASNDGISWKIPSGLNNPLDIAPPCGWNNDPSMIYNPSTNELWLYYLDTGRAMDCSGFESQPYYNHSYLKMVKSSNGLQWSSPETLIDWDLSQNDLLLSPSIVRLSDTSYYMWMTNGYDNTFMFTSSDGLSWSTNRQKINTPDYAWHLNVKYIPEKNEFWMLYDFTPQVGMLKFAKSTDGMNWTTFPDAVMMSSANGWDTNLYRSTFLYDNSTDQIKVWYSAYTSSQIWHIGYVSKNYTDFLDALTKTGQWTIDNGLGFWMTSNTLTKRGTYSGKLIQQGGYADNQMIVHAQQPLSNNFYQEWDMYDDLASSTFRLVRINGDGDIGIGIYSGSSDSNYSYHTNTYNYTVTSVSRTLGWHKFGILLKSDSSATFFIDGKSVGTLTSQFNNAANVSVEGLDYYPTTFYVDDIRVRKFASSEPVVTSTGSEEYK
jgi:hypothetical protein